MIRTYNLDGGEEDGLKHAQHPHTERQQPDCPDLRAGRRARLRGDRRVGQEGRAGLRPEGSRPAHAAARGVGPAARFPMGELRDHAVPLQQARTRAVLSDRSGQPLDAFHTFFLEGKQFIGGDSPSIADIRLAATLEFLKAIEYDFPAWTTEYMSAVETALGDAYSEPAGDVRGFIDQVKAPAA